MSMTKSMAVSGVVPTFGEKSKCSQKDCFPPYVESVVPPIPIKATSNFTI